MQWQPEVVPWGIGLGLLFGFAAEIYWHGNMLWMTGGGIGGGLLGAVCDTALFAYRHIRRKHQTNKGLHP